MTLPAVFNQSSSPDTISRASRTLYWREKDSEIRQKVTKQIAVILVKLVERKKGVDAVDMDEIFNKAVVLERLLFDQSHSYVDYANEKTILPRLQHLVADRIPGRTIGKKRRSRDEEDVLDCGTDTPSPI
jgi:hypothetical protein